MNRFSGVAGAALILLGAGGCETMKELAEATGRTKISMTLKNGKKIEGTLLQDQDGKSLVQVSYGSVTVSSGEVVKVEKTGVASAPTAGEGRLSRWDHCLHIIAERPWSKQLAQVPATVIDFGVLKNVPYLSHRSGDFEMNVYGDPDRPAGLEMGIYRGGGTPAQRQACLETMCLLLKEGSDREALLSVSGLDRALVRRNGLVFEVTPPTEKDSYGGWWISIYDETALAEQRASEKELMTITLTPSQLKRPAGLHPWQEHDLKMARPAPSEAQEPRVYKRGVFRKNGTYVVSTT
jgi:hypothetical protein